LTKTKSGKYLRGGAANFKSTGVVDMSERHAEWSARVEECTRNASVALDAAMSAISDQAKAEFLRLAEEWTRLAGAIMDAFLL
jgi:hypothetical protein